MTERLLHIPTQPGMGRSIIQHDERSKNFRAISPREADVLEPRNRRWFRYWMYDQGQSSMCVAYTGVGVMNSRPHTDNVPLEDRKKYSFREWYEGAQQNDEWEGEAYDGTSGLGLLRWMKATGKIDRYETCFGLNDVLLALSHKGPVMLGIWWYDGMFYPDASGLVRPTGNRAGGHEIELLDISVDREEVEFANSWGRSWGREGRGRMKWTDLERLLNENGDAYLIPDVVPFP